MKRPLIFSKPYYFLSVVPHKNTFMLTWKSFHWYSPVALSKDHFMAWWTFTVETYSSQKDSISVKCDMVSRLNRNKTSNKLYLLKDNLFYFLPFTKLISFFWKKGEFWDKLQHWRQSFVESWIEEKSRWKTKWTDATKSSRENAPIIHVLRILLYTFFLFPVSFSPWPNFWEFCFGCILSAE